jgi:hypothetical protein
MVLVPPIPPFPLFLFPPKADRTNLAEPAKCYNKKKSNDKFKFEKKKVGQFT